jgi:hypothetical protein
MIITAFGVGLLPAPARLPPAAHRPHRWRRQTGGRCCFLDLLE